MILLILLYLFISLACLCCGFIFYRFILFNKQLADKPLIFYAISGLITLAIAAQIIALFTPVNFYTLIIIAALICIVIIFQGKEFLSFFKYARNCVISLPWPALLLFTVLCLVISLLNAGPTLLDDTNSYHIQMIKWIREYGTVPGLANLHERYGFNSSWFSATALFGFSSQQFNLYTVLNGTLSVWFCFYLVNKSFAPGINSPASIALFIVLLFSLAIWPLVRGNAASANYDFITTFLIFILFCEIFPAKNYKVISAELFVWPVYLFTIRITTFPFLLLSLFVFIQIAKNGNWKKILTYFVIAISLIFPFLTRNILLSGYAFYPGLFLDIFKPDWKVEKSTVNELLYYIKYYNRVNIMTQPLSKTAELSFPVWILPWFKQLFFYDKIMVVTAAAGFASIIFQLKRVLKTLHLFQYLFITAIIFQLSIWFFVASDPRFVYGCLLCGIFFIFYQPAFLLKKIQLNKLRYWLIIITIPVMAVYFGQKLISRENRNFVYPRNLIIPAYKEIEYRGVVYRIPDALFPGGDISCFGLKTPCLYKLDPRLELRDGTIEKGFRIKK